MKTITIKEIEDSLRENIDDSQYIFTIFPLHIFQFSADFLREMWKNDEIHQYYALSLSKKIYSKVCNE